MHNQSTVEFQIREDKTSRARRAAALTAFVCMLAAAYGFHPEHRMALLLPAGVSLALGLLALAFAVRGLDVGLWQPGRHRSTFTLPNPTLRHDWMSLAAGVVLLALVAENNAMRLNIKSFDFMHYHVQFALFAGGIVLLLLSQRDAPRGQRITAVEWLFIAVIFIIALIPRVIMLDTLVRTLVDELPWVDGIRSLWWRQDFELLRTMSSTFPFTSLFPYMEAGVVQLLGANLFGLRFLSSLMGAATVVATYALTRFLIDRPTAVIAALILAFYPPHVHFSRLALLNMIDPLPGVMALAYAARAMRFGRRFDWALAGASLGMTHYFFEAGRLLFTPLMVTWIGWLYITGRSRVRAWGRGIAVMTLMTVLTAVPFYYVVTAQGSAFAGRLDQSRQDPAFLLDVLAGNRTIDDLARHVLTPPLMFISRPENGVYYAGYQPLVLSGFVPLFLLGLGVVLARPRRPAFVLILWLLAVIVGNIMLKDPGVSARYVVALPGVAVLMAVGLRESARLLATVFGTTMRRLVRPVVPAMVALMAAVHMLYYFGPHIEAFNVQNRTSKIYRDGIDAVLRSVQLPFGTAVVLISQPESDSNVTSHFLSFMRPDMPLSAITPQELTHRFLAELPPSQPYAFFVAPDDAHSVNLLSRYFVLQPPEISPFYAQIPTDRQYVLYFAPLGALREVPRVKNTPIQVFTPGE